MHQSDGEARNEMSVIWSTLFALLIGVSITLQSGVNAQLRLLFGNPFQAGFISFVVGTIVLGIYTLSLRLQWPVSSFTKAPWWIWTGGLLGAYVVTLIILLAPRLGATMLIALIIAGQMITALILDHYGLLGFQLHPVRWERLVGVFLLLCGAVLIRKF